MWRIISTLSLLALAGCLWPAEGGDWVGDWEGDLAPRSDPKDPVEGGAKRVSLTIKPDRSATLTLLSIPCEGRIEASGPTAHFLGQEMLGSPLARHPAEWGKRFGSVPLRLGADRITAEIADTTRTVRVDLLKIPKRS